MARRKESVAEPILGSFEGKPVTRAAVIIRKTGDGLSDALALAPQRWESGEHVFFVIECGARSIRFDPTDKTEDDPSSYARVHIFDALRIAEVPGEGVGHFLHDEVERLRRIREEQAGIQALFDSANAAAAEGEAAEAAEESIDPDETESE